MKKVYLFSVLLIMLAIVLSAFAPQELSQLYVKNKVVDEKVFVSMSGIKYGNSYYLTADAPDHAGGWIENTTFDVYKDIYDVTISFCGYSRSGTLNMVQDNRLVFPSCFTAVNSGEPGQEKVSVYSAQPGVCNLVASNSQGDGTEDGWDACEGQVHLADGTPLPFYKNGEAVAWRLDWANYKNGGSDFYEPFLP